MEAGPIELRGASGALPAYEARPPAKGARGAVVVLSEVYGLNGYVQDVTRRFAAEGYHAVAPDLFSRQGGGALPYDAGPEVDERLAGLRDDDVVADVDAALGHLASTAAWGREHVGAVGFRLGGRLSFLLAAERPLGAAVGFYGGGIVRPRAPHLPALVDRAPSLQSPWLGLYGDSDVWTPAADVERLRQRLTEAPPGIDHEVVVYAGAGHGFHCDSDPAAHEPDAAAQAWRRALQWLHHHLGPTPDPRVR